MYSPNSKKIQSSPNDDIPTALDNPFKINFFISVFYESNLEL